MLPRGLEGRMAAGRYELRRALGPCTVFSVVFSVCFLVVTSFFPK